MKPAPAPAIRLIVLALIVCVGLAVLAIYRRVTHPTFAFSSVLLTAPARIVIDPAGGSFSRAP